MRNNLDHNAPPKVPAVVLGLLVLFVVLSWIPLALIARSRSARSERQPIHLFLDMDFQPRYGPQDAQSMDLATHFADGRAMRLPVPGSVQYDSPVEGIDPDDDHFFRGYRTDGNFNPLIEQVMVSGNPVEQPRYYADFPGNLRIDRAFVERGRQRYNIYCGICHGASGYGDGIVHQRIMERQALTPGSIAGWAPPRNFHQQDMVDAPAGKLFDTITRGKFSVDPQTGKKTYTMWPYASQVPVADRWAIVAYIRTLQMAQRFPVKDLPQSMADQLPPPPQIASDPATIAEGKTLFTAKLCATCHQVDPNVIAPTGIALRAPKFMGKFWGEPREVHEGVGGPIVTVTFDEAYFIESVKEPMKKIVKDSIPGMAPLPTTDEEIRKMLAYVKSLSE